MNSEQLSGFDCWDLGGGLNSLQWAKDHYGVKNPVAINPGDEFGRVEEMEASGFTVIKKSALELPGDARTDVIQMSHFIEHLPTKEACEGVIEYSLYRCNRLLVMSGPYFEDDKAMRQIGYQFMWAAWPDHRSPILLKEIQHVLEDNFITYSLSLGFGATNTSDKDIFRLDDEGASSALAYDPLVHKPKPSIELARTYYKEFMICVAFNAEVDARKIHEARHGPNSIIGV